MAQMDTRQSDQGAFGGWLIAAILLAGLIWWIYSMMQP